MTASLEDLLSYLESVIKQLNLLKQAKEFDDTNTDLVFTRLMQ